MNERLARYEMVLEKVLKQVQKDVEDGDLTALAELLRNITSMALIAYLPEEEVEE
jgi:hypothetical protein